MRNPSVDHVKDVISWIDVLAIVQSNDTSIEEFKKFLDRLVVEGIDLTSPRTQGGDLISDLMRPPPNSSSATPIVHNIFTYAATKSLVALYLLIIYCIKFNQTHLTQALRRATNTPNSIGEIPLSIVFNRCTSVYQLATHDRNDTLLANVLGKLMLSTQSRQSDLTTQSSMAIQGIDVECLPYDANLKKMLRDVQKRLLPSSTPVVEENIVSTSAESSGAVSAGAVKHSDTWQPPDEVMLMTVTVCLEFAIRGERVPPSTKKYSAAEYLDFYLTHLIKGCVDLSSSKIVVNNNQETIGTTVVQCTSDVLNIFLGYLKVVSQQNASESKSKLCNALNAQNHVGKTPLQIALNAEDAQKSLIIIKFKKLHIVPFTAEEIAAAQELLRKLQELRHASADIKYIEDRLEIFDEMLFEQNLSLSDLQELILFAKYRNKHNKIDQFIHKALLKYQSDIAVLHNLMLLSLGQIYATQVFGLYGKFLINYCQINVVRGVFTTADSQGHRLIYHAMRLGNERIIRLILSLMDKSLVALNETEVTFAKSFSADNGMIALQKDIVAINAKIQENIKKANPKESMPVSEAIVMGVETREGSNSAASRYKKRSYTEPTPKPLLVQAQQQDNKRSHSLGIQQLAVVSDYIQQLQKNIQLLLYIIEGFSHRSTASINTNFAYGTYAKSATPGGLYLKQLKGLRDSKAIQYITTIFDELILYPEFRDVLMPAELKAKQQLVQETILADPNVPQIGSPLFQLCFAIVSEINILGCMQGTINEIKAARLDLSNAKAAFASFVPGRIDRHVSLDPLLVQHQCLLALYREKLREEFRCFFPETSVQATSARSTYKP